MKSLVALLTVLFVLSGGGAPTLAQEPSLPHFFYGELTINGTPAPTGTPVEARGAGVITGISGNPLITTGAGIYGGAGALAPKLLVQGEIAEGATIEFFVNGTRADQTAQWRSGQTTNLDLNIFIFELAYKICFQVRNKVIKAKSPKILYIKIQILG